MMQDDMRINSQADGEIKLSDMEIDALGESVNISMGAAAKALSTILNLKVNITTPTVSVGHSRDCEYNNMVPAVGVKINYMDGLSGTNFFVIRQKDVKVIVNMMMGSDEEDDGSPMTEMYISGISEVMNQMMGSSATALSMFFNKKIGISTPDCILMEGSMKANEALGYDGYIANIRFRLTIGDIIDSEMINIMPIAFAKNLAHNLVNSLGEMDMVGEQSEIPAAAFPVSQPPVRQTPRIPDAEQNTVSSAKQQAPSYAPAVFADLTPPSPAGKSALANLNIIMDVPLEVVVQIGKTRKPISEILEFTQGTIVELDKQAGDPVDIIVNGELIAKGDVVVIDDNFGVRITQIVNTVK